MSLNLAINDELPKTFIRGQTLEFYLELPESIPANWFNDGANVKTTLEATLRKKENAGNGGFIADLQPYWEPEGDSTKIWFFVGSTDEFPLGPAEFDVVFTRVNNSGAEPMERTYRSLPIQISIVDGVT